MFGELYGIVNPTLRERIDKSIVGKLINAKVNFGLGAPIKTKQNLKFTNEVAMNQSLENFKKEEST